jgi:hypothetical protein
MVLKSPSVTAEGERVPPAQPGISLPRSMPAPRRRLLSLVPMGVALSVVAAGAFVVMPGQEGVSTPEVTTEQVDLTGPSEPVAPGWVGAAEVGPNLVGVEWQGDPGAAFTIETRDEAGAWSPAGAIEATPADEGPDDGSTDARGRPGSNVSEALWVGDDVTGVRVRLDGGAAADVDLHAVESPPAVAPEGVAVAAGGPIPGGGGAGPGARLIVALATLTVAGLVVVGFRWRRFPRRRRRLATGLLLVASMGLGACVPPPAPAPAPVPGLDNLISRAGWGANEQLRLANCPGGPDYMTSVKFAVVHHTVNSNTYTASQGPQLVRGIYGYHTQSLGYCDIGYNFLVDRYGNVYEGRYGGTTRAVMGAHARGFNTSSTGVALIGDFRTAVPPAAAITALEQVLAWKLAKHQVNPTVKFNYTTAGNEKWAPGSTVTLSPITYHAYTGSTECPGTQVIKRIGPISSAVTARMGY